MLASIAFTSAGQQKTEYALTASTSFELIMARTESEMGSLALRLVREATAEHINYVSLQTTQDEEERDDQQYRSVEVVAQSVQFMSRLTSTKLKFFVLASALTSGENDSQIERQTALDNLVLSALSGNEQTELLLHRIRVKEATNRDSINSKASAQLKAIDSIIFLSEENNPTAAPALVITPTATVPGDPPISQKKQLLSTLDIALIVVSGFILIGVIWMIYVHHTDRGYFENQRLQALNAVPTDSNRETEKEAKLALTNNKKYTSSDLPAVDTPSTVDASLPSGTFEPLQPLNGTKKKRLLRPILKKPDRSVADQAVSDSHVLFMSNHLSDRTGHMDPHQLQCVASELTSDGSGELECSSSGDSGKSSAMTGHSTGGSDIGPNGSLSEPFESNWFRRTTDIMGATSLSQLGSEDSEDTDDVFHVASSYDHPPTRSPAEMYEWLRSIHVIGSDARSAESSQQSELGRRPLEVSSLSHLSLEQSMVSSAVASRKRDADKSTGSL